MGAIEIISEQRTVVRIQTSSCRLQRFSGDYGKWNVGSSNFDMVSFIADQDIEISGIGLGSSLTVGGSIIVDCIEIRKSRSSRGDVVYRHPATIRLNYSGVETDKYPKVNFSDGVRIKKHKVYTIKVHYSTKGTVFAAGGTVATSAGGTSFKFMKTACEGGDEDNNGNAKTAGPIRDLYFTN
mmetsp:Transcript_13008/g.24158  ORF Transcript_13008/g.24158 Transcript_13008/m.24158 type:complete len:182 (+) Transcript_13008:1-546(+)